MEALKLVPKQGKAPAKKVVVKLVATQVAGVVPMVREAFKRDNRLAMLCGSVLGGFVPIASYVLAHNELGERWYTSPRLALVCGGLLYSAKTVVQWAQMAFRDKYKAYGFAVLVEGVMTFSRTPWLGALALGLLVFINACATGVTLSRSK